MTRIAILSPSVSTGDAVGNDVLGMFNTLREQGVEARVYAESGSLNGVEVWRASKIQSFLSAPEDLLIYHFSMGWEAGLRLINNLRCRTAIRYHNITPPHFFQGISAPHEHMSREGRAQLKRIARSEHDLYLSASEYNMRELLAEGAAPERNLVIPPFHHLDLLLSLNPDRSVTRTYDDGKTNLLTVGRVVPHKGHISLIEAYAAYHYQYNSNSRLLIVGKQDEAFSSYYQQLHHLVSSLSLEHAVSFTGGVSDEELRAFYTTAHLFLTTSEHEGFCVPIVEAMAMKLPVVAYSSSAIPWTVGDAGVVWEERNPLLIAETIHQLMQDEGLRAGLAERGYRRYEQLFANRRIEAEFLRALSSLR